MIYCLRFFRLFLIISLLWSCQAFSADPWSKLGNSNQAVKAELIAKTLTAQPGKVLEVGIYLKHDRKWHTYWKATGDTGLPTQVTWKLPQGWTAGDIRWPTPKIFRLGPLVNYGYDNQVLLPVSIQVPQDAALESRVELKAKVSWLMCEDQCIPGRADLTLTVNVAETAVPSSHQALFAATEKKIPVATTVSEARLDPKSKLIELAFADKEQAKDLYVFAEGRETILYAAPQTTAYTADGYSIYLSAGELIKPGDEFAGILVSQGGPDNSGWARSFSAKLTEGTVTIPAQNDQVKNLTLWIAAVFAFFGGLILNLMPCVFPVLSLKLIGIVENRHNNSLVAHGLGFLTGVLTTMTALAALLVAVKSTGSAVGWGFQLQSPWFVAALALLFTAITVNLLGGFEFTLGSAGAGKLAAKSKKSPFVDSFLTGILAVVVASPCTAPFMGAALGYALTAPALESFCTFIALGLGMAFPWVLITLVPVLTRWLPKPGRWMEIFKKLMAIPMLLTALWLFWVLSQQVGTLNLSLFIGSVVFFTLALYAYGRIQFGSAKALAACLVSLGVSVACYLVGAVDMLEDKPTAVVAANAWSEQAVSEALAQNKPVFVDFTASWCVTCQANKLTSLRSAQVQEAFRKHNFVVLEADWTNYDEKITKALEHFGRSGVPLYVIYMPDGAVHILPELLTPGIVTDAIAEAFQK